MLDPEEAAQVAEHLRDCRSCAARAAEWRGLGEALRRLPHARPSLDLLDRTCHAVEWRLAERSEQAWKRAALGFLVAFSWVLAGVAWLVIDVFGRAGALGPGWSIRATAACFVAYVVTGWVMAGATAVLLGRRAREQWRRE